MNRNTRPYHLCPRAEHYLEVHAVPGKIHSRKKEDEETSIPVPEKAAGGASEELH